MELLLNLTWLNLALAGLGWWYLRFWRRYQGRGVALRRLGAVVYSLAILFPVISVTDDLQAQPAAYEEPSPTRRLNQSGDEPGIAAVRPLGAFCGPAAITSVAALYVPNSSMCLIGAPAAARIDSLSIAVVGDRAPPPAL